MIGVACSTTDLTMGPPGAKEPFMGNNPFAFAFKSRREISGILRRYGDQLGGDGKMQGYGETWKRDSTRMDA